MMASCKSVLNHCSSYVDPHSQLQPNGKGWKDLLPIQQGNAEADTGTVLLYFCLAFRILQSDIIGDYLPQCSHMLWVPWGHGREEWGKEGGGHDSTAGYSSVFISANKEEFGHWSVSRGILEVTPNSPFSLSAFLPSDLPCDLIKTIGCLISPLPLCLSLHSFFLFQALSLFLYLALSSFGLHEWLCISLERSVQFSDKVKGLVLLLL